MAPFPSLGAGNLRAVKRLVLAGFALASAAVVAGCGGNPPPVASAILLSDARQVVNQAKAVHFTLSSQNLPSTGTTLQGGAGDLSRPDQLQGTFQVSLDGLPASVKLIEVGGKFYAELPFTSHYKVTQPAQFGLGDPAQLLDPNAGVSRLLTELANPKVTGERRVNGELLEEIAGTVPGTDVDGFLPDVDSGQPVRLVLDINPTSHQVRQVAATGPFASVSVASTYVVTLTKYGESVAINPPPT